MKEHIARAIGKTNTIVWQFVPPFVLVAKFAEVRIKHSSNPCVQAEFAARAGDERIAGVA